MKPIINEPFSPRRKLGLTLPQRFDVAFIASVLFLTGYFLKIWRWW